MNVGQLKKELEKYPDEMDVFIDERVTEFNYGLLNSVRDQMVAFAEEPDDEPMAEANCVILSEM